MEIVPIYLERKDDGKFYMEVQESIQVNNADKSEENKKNITVEINKRIEKMVLRNPRQWIWTHSRWK